MSKDQPKVKDRAQLLLSQTDLARIIYAIKLARGIEQPRPSTMRKLRRAFERSGGEWAESPPAIVACAPNPAAALEAFIIQELECWGFLMEMRSGEFMCTLPSGVTLAVTVHEP
jgi:hypothetical protein